MVDIIAALIGFAVVAYILYAMVNNAIWAGQFVRDLIDSVRGRKDPEIQCTYQGKPHVVRILRVSGRFTICIDPAHGPAYKNPVITGLENQEAAYLAMDLAAEDPERFLENPDTAWMRDVSPQSGEDAGHTPGAPDRTAPTSPPPAPRPHRAGPLGPAPTAKGVDFGTEVVEALKESLQITEDHVVALPDETIWRADNLPVRLHFFNRPRDSRPFFRVGLSVDLAHGVEADSETVQTILDLLNRECTLASYRFDAEAGRVTSDMSWTFHDTSDSTMTGFTIAAVLTIWEAERRARVFIDRGLGLRPRVDGLPDRSASVPSLALTEQIFAAGQDSSAFSGTPIESLESGLPWLMAFSSDDDLTGQYRYRQDIEPDPVTPQGTTLVAVHAGEHPSIGSGALVLLQVAESLDDPVAVAALLNDREVVDGPAALGLGAWCSDDDSVAHATFVPSFAAETGLLRKVVEGHADRSRWLWHELH